MHSSILEKLESLPLPRAVTAYDAKALLAENIAAAKIVLGEGWIPLESDPYVKNLKILTLRQLHNQEQKNITVRRILITVATGSDLDHLGIGEHVHRLEGNEPVSRVSFHLAYPKSIDMVIPKGTILSDATGVHNSFLLEDIKILKGTTSAQGDVKFDKKVISSPVRCESISSFDDIEVKQLSDFEHGSLIEDDKRYRVRILQSSVQYNTTGSYSAYRFHAFSADNRIDDVEIGEGDGIHVPVYIYSKDGVSDELIEKVDTYLNQKHLKPLNDKPVVTAVVVKSIVISVDIYIFDLFSATKIRKEIEDSLVFNFYINKNFTKSEFIAKCHVAGVYEAVTDFEGVETKSNEIIEVKSITLNFKKAIV